MTAAELRGHPLIVTGSSQGRVLAINLEPQRPIATEICLQSEVTSVACTANQLLIGTSAELLRIDLA